MRALLAGLQFMTRLPVKGSYTEEEIGLAVLWFPVIGLILGAIDATVWLLLSLMTHEALLLRALLVVCVHMVLTGGLHLDGLADTADGCLSGRSVEGVLKIMKDSRIGAMGTLVLWAVLSLKMAALSEMPQSAIVSALIIVPALARTAQLAAIACCDYLTDRGLASLFFRHASWPFAVASALVLFVLAAVLLPVGALSMPLGMVIPIMMIWRIHRRLGGITGDVLGALCEVAEASLLVCWAFTALCL